MRFDFVDVSLTKSEDKKNAAMNSIVISNSRAVNLLINHTTTFDLGNSVLFNASTNNIKIQGDGTYLVIHNNLELAAGTDQGDFNSQVANVYIDSGVNLVSSQIDSNIIAASSGFNVKAPVIYTGPTCELYGGIQVFHDNTLHTATSTSSTTTITLLRSRIPAS